MDIISRRERVTEVSYSLFFQRVGEPGSGYSFPCDEHGVMADQERGFLLYVETLRMAENLEAPVVQRFENRYSIPALGRCVCGQRVRLEGFTNTCESCNRDYNMSGQELAPRSQWGEETGETLGEILRIR